jgi:retinoid hydroxylase
MKTLADLPTITIPEDYQTRVGPFQAQMYQQHGPIFKAEWNHGTVVYMVGPEANRFVLLEGRDAFSHDKGWTPIVGEMLGRGLLNMDGPEHNAQRKMMNPAFATDYMDRYLPIMNRVIQTRIADWAERGVVDVYDEARKITFDVAAEALVGFSPGAEVDEFRRLFTILLQGDPASTNEEQAYAAWMNARNQLGPMLMEQIHARRQAPTDDVLGMLVRARDAQGNALSDEQLLGHTNILLVAGHETSTSLSAWLLYLLAENPAYLERVRAELRETMGEVLDGEPTLEAVKRMKVLGYALSEAERLYPPVANGPRGASRDFEFNGYTIPVDTRVVYGIAGGHMLPSVWANPERFDPDRFAPPREEDKKHPYALVGFGGGPRVCIGINFATVEIKAMAAIILSRFNLEITDRPQQVYQGTGFPMGGIKLRVTERSQA